MEALSCLSCGSTSLSHVKFSGIEYVPRPSVTREWVGVLVDAIKKGGKFSNSILTEALTEAGVAIVEAKD